MLFYSGSIKLKCALECDNASAESSLNLNSFKAAWENKNSCSQFLIPDTLFQQDKKKNTWVFYFLNTFPKFCKRVFDDVKETHLHTQSTDSH